VNVNHELWDTTRGDALSALRDVVYNANDRSLQLPEGYIDDPPTRDGLVLAGIERVHELVNLDVSLYEGIS